jgi:hypothetical protein
MTTLTEEDKRLLEARSERMLDLDPEEAAEARETKEAQRAAALEKALHRALQRSKRAAKKLQREGVDTEPASPEEEILQRLTELEALQHDFNSRLMPLTSIHKHLRAMAIQVEALVRKEFVSQLGALDPPFALTVNRVPLLGSGTSDAGVLLAALAQTGVGTRRYVDIGCGSSGGTTVFLSVEMGWEGLLIDGSEEAIARRRHVFDPTGARSIAAFITRENVNQVLEENGMSGDIDVLSIDIDGNDYWIWDAIEVVQPRVVVAEYNWRFGATEAITVPYRPDFDRKAGGLPQGYHGTSLAALAALARRKGYRLVACDPDGDNSFYIRNDLAPDIREVEPALAYRVRRHPDGGKWEPPEEFLERTRAQGLDFETVA